MGITVPPVVLSPTDNSFALPGDPFNVSVKQMPGVERMSIELLSQEGRTTPKIAELWSNFTVDPFLDTGAKAYSFIWNVPSELDVIEDGGSNGDAFSALYIRASYGRDGNGEQFPERIATKSELFSIALRLPITGLGIEQNGIKVNEISSQSSMIDGDVGTSAIFYSTRAGIPGSDRRRNLLQDFVKAPSGKTDFGPPFRFPTFRAPPMPPPMSDEYVRLNFTLPVNASVCGIRIMQSKTLVPNNYTVYLENALGVRRSLTCGYIQGVVRDLHCSMRAVVFSGGDISTDTWGMDSCFVASTIKVELLESSAPPSASTRYRLYEVQAFGMHPIVVHAPASGEVLETGMAAELGWSVSPGMNHLAFDAMLQRWDNETAAWHDVSTELGGASSGIMDVTNKTMACRGGGGDDGEKDMAWKICEKSISVQLKHGDWLPPPNRQNDGRTLVPRVGAPPIRGASALLVGRCSAYRYRVETGGSGYPIAGHSANFSILGVPDQPINVAWQPQPHDPEGEGTAPTLEWFVPFDNECGRAAGFQVIYRKLNASDAGQLSRHRLMALQVPDQLVPHDAPEEDSTTVERINAEASRTLPAQVYLNRKRPPQLQAGWEAAEVPEVSLPVEDARTYGFQSLAAGTFYIAYVRATNKYGNGLWSDMSIGYVHPTKPPRPPSLEHASADSIDANATAIRIFLRSSMLKTLDDGGAMLASVEMEIRGLIVLEGTGEWAMLKKESIQTVSASVLGNDEDGVRFGFHHLKPASQYALRMRMSNAAAMTSDMGPYFYILTDPDVPDAAKLIASGIAGDRVSFTWLPPDANGAPITAYYAKQFAIQVQGRNLTAADCDDAGATGLPAKLGADQMSADMVGLKPVTQYGACGRAENAQGNGSWGFLSMTTAALPPNPPQEVRFDVVGDQRSGELSYRISWTPSVDQGSAVTGYAYQYGTSVLSFGPLKHTLGTSFNVSGLQAATVYYIRVKAKSAVGNSPWRIGEGTTSPNVPGNVSIAFVDTNKGDMLMPEWTAAELNGGTLKGYDVRLFRGDKWVETQGCNADELAASATRARLMDQSSIFRDLTAVTTYTVCVRAWNERGAGPWAHNSSTTGALVPLPGTLRAVEVSATRLTVTWDAWLDRGDNIDAVELSVGGEYTVEQTLSLDYRTKTNVTIGGLRRSTTYTIRCRMNNTIGMSEWMSIAVTTNATAPHPCPAPAIDSVQSTAIALSASFPRDDGGAQIQKAQVCACPADGVNSDVTSTCNATGCRSELIDASSNLDGAQKLRIGGLSSGVRYQLAVRFRNDQGWGNYSDARSETTVVSKLAAYPSSGTLIVTKPEGSNFTILLMSAGSGVVDACVANATLERLSSAGVRLIDDESGSSLVLSGFRLHPAQRKSLLAIFTSVRQAPITQVLPIAVHWHEAQGESPAASWCELGSNRQDATVTNVTLTTRLSSEADVKKTNFTLGFEDGGVTTSGHVSNGSVDVPAGSGLVFSVETRDLDGMVTEAASAAFKYEVFDPSPEGCTNPSMRIGSDYLNRVVDVGAAPGSFRGVYALRRKGEFFVHIKVRPSPDMNTWEPIKHKSGSACMRVQALARECNGALHEAADISGLKCVCASGFTRKSDGVDGATGSCRACAAGTFKSEDGNIACTSCEKGKFSFPNATACERAPAIVPGGPVALENGVLQFRQGYWRKEARVATMATRRRTRALLSATSNDVTTSTSASAPPLPISSTQANRNASSVGFEGHHGLAFAAVSEDTVFYRCLRETDCLVNNVTGAITCAKGHDPDGPLCAQCSDGYIPTADACIECPSKSVALVGAAVATVVSGLFAMWFVRRQTSRTRAAGTTGVCLRILVSYVQVVALLGDYREHGPALFYTSVRWTSSFADGGGDVAMAPPRCILGWTFYGRLAFTIALPPLAAIFAALIVLPDMFRKDRGKASFFDQWIAAAVVLLMLCHSRITSELFKTFRCSAPIDGTRYLIADFSLKCGTAKHNMARIAAGSFLALYSIGIPGSACVYLWLNRSKLSTPAMERRFGFFYDGYRREDPSQSLFLWECVVAMRKVGISAISSLLADYPATQSLTAATLLVVFLTAQLVARPFQIPAMNALEAASMISLYAILTGSMMYTGGGTATNDLAPDAHDKDLMVTVVLSLIFFGTIIAILGGALMPGRRPASSSLDGSESSDNSDVSDSQRSRDSELELQPVAAAAPANDEESGGRGARADSIANPLLSRLHSDFEKNHARTSTRGSVVDTVNPACPLNRL